MSTWPSVPEARCSFLQLLTGVRAACEAHYGSRLVALAVFGSVGRGTPQPDSDVDLLLIAEGLPNGRLPRMAEFQAVETAVEPRLAEACRELRQRFGRRLVSGRFFGSYARGEATAESDVDCLVLLDRVDRDDERAITDLAADLTWQIAGVVISPLTMSVSEFEAWNALELERRTPLEIEREGIPL